MSRFRQRARQQDWGGAWYMEWCQGQKMVNTQTPEPLIHELVRLYSPANSGAAGAVGSIPGWGRSPGGGNGNQLHYSCLDNSMDVGDLWVIIHKIAKELDMTEHACDTMHIYIYAHIYIKTQGKEHSKVSAKMYWIFQALNKTGTPEIVTLLSK